MSINGFFVALEVDGDGAHPASWRFAQHVPDALIGPARTLESVRRAERHGFSAVTIDDGVLPPQAEPGITQRLDAVLRAAFVATHTSSIGLVPFAEATYAEPFHLAAQYATLDHVSAGRAGWLVGADGGAAAAHAYGRAEEPDHAVTRAVTADVIRASRLLWDSWQDDATIRDTASGRYLDADRIHGAGFVGRAFSVQAAAITPRPPQGQIVRFARQEALPASLTDVALVTGRSLEAVVAAAIAARGTGVPRVIAELDVVLDVQGRPAAVRLTELDAAATRDGLDAAPERFRHVGDAASLVALLARLAEVVDGVRLHPAVLDVDGEELGRAVLPLLRGTGLFRSPAHGATLRDSLGLERPENLFVTGGAKDLQHITEEISA